jgi:uncharacterized protein (TIGR03435 family)
MLLCSCKQEEKKAKTDSIIISKYMNTDEDVVLEDKYLVVDFWATWCVPCIKGFDDFDALASSNEFKDRANFVLLAEEPEAKLNRRLNGRTFNSVKLAIDSLITNDKGKKVGKTFTKYDVPYLPFSIVFDPNGEKLWSGSTKKLNTEFLKEIIDGKDDNETQNTLTNTSKKSKKIDLDTIAGDHYTIITGRTYTDAPYGSIAKDQSSYNLQSVSLTQLIKDLTGKLDYAIVSNKNLDTIYYKVNYKGNIEALEAPFQTLANKLFEHHNIKTENFTKLTEVYELKLIDKVLLQKAETLQKEDGHGGWDTENGRIISINEPIGQLVKLLNETVSSPIVLGDGFDTTIDYDFDIQLSDTADMEELMDILENSYGLTLDKKTKEIDYLKVEI